MQAEAIRRYAKSRDYSMKAFRAGCYAPFVALQFNPDGLVKVCCQNYYHPVGHIPEQSITEIWNGPRIQELRRAQRRFSYDMGCEYCKWEVLEGNDPYGRMYDEYPVSPAEEVCPRLFEFVLYNTCNLECAQCDEYFSSAIRKRRTNLPPLPRVYGEEFFAELRPYLPHLAYTVIAGGEPFLVQENFRLWDLLIEDQLPVRCHIITNGTIFNERVERVLEGVNCQLAVSMDGVTRQTLEGIRRNLKFDAFLANFQKFHAHSLRKGTPLLINVCLMRQNWHEFADLLLFADAHDCPVVVFPLVAPRECSLFTLSREELRTVVESLEGQSASVVPQLRHNAATWTGEVARLRNHLDHEFPTDFYSPKELVQLGQTW